jgi:cyclin D1/2/4, plant
MIYQWSFCNVIGVQQVGDVKYLFKARDIKRMELHVFSTLKWRLQAVTPFSFISYFLDKFNEGKPPSFAVASRCAEIIVGTLKGLIDIDLIA